MYWELAKVLVVTLWAVSMWVVVGWIFWKAWGPWIRSRRFPLTRVPAVVTEKEQEAKYVAEYDKAEITRRFMKFDCKDGVVREFEVPEKLFEIHVKGDHGTLVYRGEMFIGFEGARIASNLEDMYKRMVRGR